MLLYWSAVAYSGLSHIKQVWLLKSFCTLRNLLVLSTHNTKQRSKLVFIREKYWMLNLFIDILVFSITDGTLSFVLPCTLYFDPPCKLSRTARLAKCIPLYYTEKYQIKYEYLTCFSNIVVYHSFQSVFDTRQYLILRRNQTFITDQLFIS